MKRLSIVVTALLLAFAIPTEGFAQADIKVGPRVGVPLGDLSDSGNVFFGVDARYASEDLPVVINPSFDFYLMDSPQGGSQNFFAIDGNALYEFAIEDASIVPFAGGGIGITRYSSSSNSQFGSISASWTDVGLNLVGGARFPLESVEPFVQANFGLGDFDRVGIAGGILFSI